MKKYYSVLLAIAPFTFLFAQPSVFNYESNLSEYDNLVYDVALNEDSPGSNGFSFVLENVSINTKYSDFSCGLFRGKFISYSARKIGALDRKDRHTNEPFTKLFCSDVTENWNIERPLLFSYLLNKNENLGGVAFSEDEKTLYFTKSIKEDTRKFQLFKATADEKRPGKWKDINGVHFNNRQYSIEDPFLSPDGTMLFFASNMPGSIGGYDIYQASVGKDGSLGEVKSVRGNINTIEDEKFPRTSADGKYLYFSSKGHENNGGFDLFMTRRTTQGYSSVVNLGNTVNTEKDEIAFFPAEENIGFITSNREGGLGGYDIYKVREFHPELLQKLNGQVIDAKTNEPLSEAYLHIIDADGVEIKQLKTDNDGKFNMPIKAFDVYTITCEKSCFNSETIRLETNNKKSVLQLQMKLEKEIIEVETVEMIVKTDKKYLKADNIQFDYNSAEITSEAQSILNTIYQTLIEQPEIRLELNAHTDSQGDFDYNLKLSQRRANSAMLYLLAKGIDQSRLNAFGKGESEPLIDCELCTESQHETNRRIEFLIIESN
ncbi:WD40 repeat protein [Ulvibacter antarcticus]|uniref:WD40 repeat protein n=2 Tax=Ulvibacter antarcticus TaxID=442714 RepID=A0A3L9Z7G4_9FLAO|nr:WD40 repeat protein [Ulvibacter antarcticus]